MFLILSLKNLRKKKLNTVSIEDISKVVCSVPYPSVKKRCAKTVKLIFAFACNHHYIVFNPSIVAVQNVRNELSKPEKRNVIYSIEQIKYLFYVCKQNFRDMYMPLLLSLTIGTRISKTIALTYSDIDFSSNTIYIERQLECAVDKFSSWFAIIN